MLSPLADRYRNKVLALETIFSEYGLVRARAKVEAEWLLFLGEKGIAPKVGEKLRTKIDKFNQKDFAIVKKIESVTNHDVKAVEYFLRKQVSKKAWPWIHFACTSEDINNTAYALLFRDGREVILKFLNEIEKDLKNKAEQWKSVAMLGRTHGQNATSTTMGKEFAVFYYRLSQIANTLQKLTIPAKFNGATGNFASHVSAFPQIDWIKFSQEFVEKKLKLNWNPLTTQIESHDGQSAVLNEISRLCGVLIDLCRDVWGYISVGYFGQKVVDGEVGSSTMPHKVNPIDFENAEGNFKLARGIARTLTDELPISRWQRDLTDSTLQRNFGLVFGHFLLGMKSLQKGLGKLELKKDVLKKDLRHAPEVLTEAIQTVMRAHGHADAYDQLKKFSRGQALDLDQIHKFIDTIKIPEADKKRLKELTPEKYIGVSAELVERFVR